jgi:hypothetical protein
MGHLKTAEHLKAQQALVLKSQQQKAKRTTSGTKNVTLLILPCFKKVGAMLPVVVDVV